MNWLLGMMRKLTDLQVSIADIADILTVAILIYVLLVLLRGTRAMQMLWGIVIIVALWIAASTFKLITLSTILTNLLTFLPIAIIVLFQQEIRRMLTAFGSTAIFRWGRRPEEGPRPSIAASPRRPICR